MISELHLALLILSLYICQVNAFQWLQSNPSRGYPESESSRRSFKLATRFGLESDSSEQECENHKSSHDITSFEQQEYYFIGLYVTKKNEECY